MKLKKYVIGLSIICILGIGANTVNAAITDDENNNNQTIQQNGRCRLTQEEQKLMEKGYSELTQEEKEMFDNYHRQPKRDLSDEDLEKYHKIEDKVCKYMDEDFKARMKERRENCNRKFRDNRGQGKKQGQRQNQCKMLNK